MPAVVFPNTFVAGAALAPDPVAENLHKPLSTPVAADVINGQLDAANFNSTVRRGQIQDGALTLALGMGATADLDFFEELYNFDSALDPNLDDPAVDLDRVYIPVANVARTFFLPWVPTLTLFTWTLAWANDAVGTIDGGGVVTATNQMSAVKLFVDGSAAGHTRREVRMSVNRFATPDTRTAKWYDRLYSGNHFSVSLGAGWHTAGLRLAMTCRQTRIRVRSFRVFAFR